MLWLWRRQVATAPIRPLAWEPPHATERPKEIAKIQKKKKEIRTKDERKVGGLQIYMHVCISLPLLNVIYKYVIVVGWEANFPKKILTFE